VELDELFAEVRGLAEALMETRDLRLQLGALDAMALTAEAVRDWRNEMSRVVAALRRSIPLRALVTAFARPEGAVDVVVFWNGESSGAERRALVDLTRARWEGTGAAPDQAAFAHADLPGPRGDSPPPPPLDACRTSFFGVRVPQVGGVTQVGLAIAGDFAVRPLALRGVLATLANAAGALRAIDGYVRQIEFHATRDALTELPNRRMFFELLHYEVERARRHGYLFAVLVLDLDGFKQVNDTYGHAYGDVFLAALAANLREIARTEDVLARYGGDEFVMLLSGANAEHARAVGERLIERVAAFTLTAPDGAVLHAGVSVGVAVHPRDAASADELFRRADTEMYRAKAAGKGCLRMAGEG
jgi:diguanylate cyclase (GGDEF)-like protein